MIPLLAVAQAAATAEPVGGLQVSTIEWILLGVLILVLVVVGVLLWRRHRAGAGPSPVKAPDDPPLAETWDDFISTLTPKVRGAPTTLVIGDRRAGKTALVERARQGVLTGISSTVDLRLGLNYGDGQITAELATEVLDDAQDEGVRERRGLFARMGWQTPLVIIVVDSSAATMSARGLADLGRRARVAIDELTSARGRRPWVRLCVSHADVSMPGYVDFIDALCAVTEAPDGNFEAPFLPAHLTAEALFESVGGLRPYALHTLRTPALSPALDVVDRTAPHLVGLLASLMTPLFTSETGVQAPIFDGVYLAALLDRPRTVGDTLEMSLVSPDVTRGRRKLLANRALQALLGFAVLAGLLVVPYVPHEGKVEQAQAQVRAFNSVANAAGSSERPLDSIAKAAGVALARALDPAWPPLRSAFAITKADLAVSYALAVRRAYLLPAAHSDDIDRRAAALALMYVHGDAALQAAIARDPETFARHLGVQRFVVEFGLRFTAPAPAEPPTLPSLQGDVGSRQGLTVEWKAFLDGVAVAAGRPRLRDVELEILQGKARHLAAGLEQIDTAWTTQTVIAALDERALPVRTWFGQMAVDQPEWLQEQRTDLHTVTRMVGLTSLAIPDPAGKDLAEAIADIDRIAPPRPADERPTATASAEATTRGAGDDAPGRAPAIAEPTGRQRETRVGLVVDDMRYTFDLLAWQTLVSRSRVDNYIEGLLAALEVQSGDALLVGRQRCRGAVGAAATTGRGSIFGLPCTYTRKTYESYVARPIAAVDPLLSRIGVPPATRDSLWDAIDSALDAYAINYGDALLAYYAGFELHCHSPEALQIDVGRMVAPGSFFVDFVETVARNADLPETVEARGDIAEVVAGFAPIVRIMEGQKGRYPTLETYLETLALARPSIASRPRPPIEPDADLGGRLAPIGRLALEMLAGGENSPAAQVDTWLDQNAMPADLRGPFRAAIDCAWTLGLTEIEDVAHAAYTHEVVHPMRALLAKFPFDRRADVDATARQVKQLLGPGGAYASAFARLLGPLVDRTDSSRFVARIGIDGHAIALPPGALALARYVSDMRSTLWNPEGEPRPIVLRVAAQPLPAGAGGRAPTLASLTAGESVAFGFNQAPSWQDFPIPWGAGAAASVAVRTATLDETDEHFGAVEADPSDWAFYRLLTRGAVHPRRDGDTDIAWTVTDSARSTTPARFRFRGDPWAPFDQAPEVQ